MLTPRLLSSKHDFIQLTPFDQKREEAQMQRKIAWFERNLASQIGLRWLIEAMCPNIDLILPSQHAPPHSFGNLAAVSSWIYPPVPIPDAESEKIARQFMELLELLKTRRTVLVGHNLFIDLIYLFSTFFGVLPDRVEEFQQIIAQLFPLVFDTKYLADTINDNSPSYKSSLEELDRELSKLPVPAIGEHRHVTWVFSKSGILIRC